MIVSDEKISKDKKNFINSHFYFFTSSLLIVCVKLLLADYFYLLITD